MSLIEKQEITRQNILADPRGDEDEKYGRFDAAENQGKVSGKFPSSTELKDAENELIKKDSVAEASGVRTSNYNTQGGMIAAKILADKEQKKDEQKNREFIALQTRYENVQQALKERIQACKDVRKLIENGEFDKENPEHMEKIRKVLGKDATDEQVEAFLNLPPEQQIQFLDAVDQHAEAVLENLVEQGCNEESVAATEDAYEQSLFSYSLDDDLDIDVKNAVSAKAEEVKEHKEEKDLPDDEVIGDFSRALGRIDQEYPDPSQSLERLQAQKDLIDGLSDGEQRKVAFSGSFDDIFMNDDYFKALDNTVDTVAQNEVAPSSSPMLG